MANRQKYPALQLRGERYQIAESREPGDPIIKIGFVDIDRTIFKKTAKEKEILRLAKLQCKADELRR